MELQEVEESWHKREEFLGLGWSHIKETKYIQKVNPVRSQRPAKHKIQGATCTYFCFYVPSTFVAR